VVDVIVTLIFRASVEAQSGAYATGVLVLILSASFAVTLALWQERSWLLSVYFALMVAVFLYTLIDNCIARPDGVIIATIFIFVLLSLSALSRYMRSTELRVPYGYFTDRASAELGPLLGGKKVHMVPVKTSSLAERQRKAEDIRRFYNVKEPLAFVHVNLLDNRSEFVAPLEVEVRREGRHYVAEIHGAIAIANTLAYLSEMTDPISIFLGLSRRNQMRQAFRYLLLGEGETGLMVYAILVRYWETTPEEDVRPRIYLMCD
jgi:hypothetical protein